MTNKPLPSLPRSTILRQAFPTGIPSTGPSSPARTTFSTYTAFSTATRTARSALSRAPRSRSRRAFEKFLQHRLAKKAKKALTKMMGIKKQQTFSVMNVNSSDKRVTQPTIVDEPSPQSSNRASNTPSICVTNPSTRDNKRTTFMIHQGRTATPPPPERIAPRMAHPPVMKVHSPTYTAVTSVATVSVAPSAVPSSVASGDFPGQVNPIRVASRDSRRLTAQKLNQVDGISSGNPRRLTAGFRKSLIPDRPPTIGALPYRAPLASEPFERPVNEYVSDHDRRMHQNRLASAFSIDTTITLVEQDTADARNAAAAALEGKSKRYHTYRSCIL
ncbi:hypothetical protein HII31_13628 [Pseudocercospora fuligena]|uniref:Uncharacterized protein n=1 Tax=Pseudocercospora fuligena TaxID=685502 RepID=A0A8H6VBD2_9PEZI|nr:hypothetical protein HII31_13628 [Pseudocercospora fuligena]